MLVKEAVEGWRHRRGGAHRAASWAVCVGQPGFWLQTEDSSAQLPGSFKGCPGEPAGCFFVPHPCFGGVVFAGVAGDQCSRQTEAVLASR